MTQITELAAKVERLSDVLANFYDYTHCERMSTDGAVTYSTSAINHHAFMALNAINETPSAALETLKAQRQADNAGFVRLALELCDAVESMTGLPPVKRAMRFGRLVNSIRQRAQEDGHESTRS